MGVFMAGLWLATTGLCVAWATRRAAGPVQTSETGVLIGAGIAGVGSIVLCLLGYGIVALVGHLGSPEQSLLASVKALAGGVPFIAAAAAYFIGPAWYRRTLGVRHWPGMTAGVADASDAELDHLHSSVGASDAPVVRVGLPNVQPCAIGRGRSDAVIVLPSNFPELSLAASGGDRALARLFTRFVVLHEASHLVHGDVGFMMWAWAFSRVLLIALPLTLLLAVLPALGGEPITKSLLRMGMLGGLLVLLATFLRLLTAAVSRKRELLADARATMHLTDDELERVMGPIIAIRGQHMSPLAAFEMVLGAVGASGPALRLSTAGRDMTMAAEPAMAADDVALRQGLRGLWRSLLRMHPHTEQRIASMQRRAWTYRSEPGLSAESAFWTGSAAGLMFLAIYLIAGLVLGALGRPLDKVPLWVGVLALVWSSGYMAFQLLAPLRWATASVGFTDSAIAVARGFGWAVLGWLAPVATALAATAAKQPRTAGIGLISLSVCIAFITGAMCALGVVARFLTVSIAAWPRGDGRAFVAQLVGFSPSVGVGFLAWLFWGSDHASASQGWFGLTIVGVPVLASLGRLVSRQAAMTGDGAWAVAVRNRRLTGDIGGTNLAPGVLGPGLLYGVAWGVVVLLVGLVSVLIGRAVPPQVCGSPIAPMAEAIAVGAAGIVVVLCVAPATTFTTQGLYWLALSGAPELAGDPALSSNAVDRVVQQCQGSAGGYRRGPKAPIEAADATAEVVLVRHFCGLPVDAQALTWLTSCGSPSGGFGPWPGTRPRLRTTAQVIAALSTAGPARTCGGRRHIGWISSLQRPDGSFRDGTSMDSPAEQTRHAIDALSLLRGLGAVDSDACAGWLANRWGNSRQTLHDAAQVVPALTQLGKLPGPLRGQLVDRWLPERQVELTRLRPDLASRELAEFAVVVRVLFPSDPERQRALMAPFAVGLASGWRRMLGVTPGEA